MNKILVVYKRCGLIIGNYRILRGFFLRLLSICYTANLKLAGAKIGKNSLIQYGTRVEKPKKLRVGSNCLICKDVSIVSELEEGELVIEDQVQVNNGVILDHAGGIIIKKGTLISEQAIIYTHSHGYNPRSNPKAIPLVIEENTWIGSKAIILPSVNKIEEGSIVASGAVLTKNTIRNSIFAGNPAKYIKDKPL
ncbi:acyltransferase [Pseudalkalibacillus sp. A8]|uniref:acyltransferase n=1 Tax=Pseudalkalibacillus sp. A8 TaxID=3382641 RepID=UPI0038B67608